MKTTTKQRSSILHAKMQALAPTMTSEPADMPKEAQREIVTVKIKMTTTTATIKVTEVQRKGIPAM